MLNEAARVLADDSGKPLYFRVGPTEKTPVWLKLTAKRRAGHGAIPNPDSAVNRLVAACATTMGHLRPSRHPSLGRIKVCRTRYQLRPT